VRSCARRSFAAETTFMALVICRVFTTLRIRRRMSRMLGMVLSREYLVPSRIFCSVPVTRYYFATASRSLTNCCFACLITSVNCAFRGSSRIFFSMIVRSNPALVASTYL